MRRHRPQSAKKRLPLTAGPTISLATLLAFSAAFDALFSDLPRLLATLFRGHSSNLSRHGWLIPLRFFASCTAGLRPTALRETFLASSAAFQAGATRRMTDREYPRHHSDSKAPLSGYSVAAIPRRDAACWRAPGHADTGPYTTRARGLDTSVLTPPDKLSRRRQSPRVDATKET